MIEHNGNRSQEPGLEPGSGAGADSRAFHRRVEADVLVLFTGLSLVSNDATQG